MKTTNTYKKHDINPTWKKGTGNVVSSKLPGDGKMGKKSG
jgi:hypothetical protein